jgi:hypothetical protein
MRIDLILDRPPSPVMAHALELLHVRGISVEHLYSDIMLMNVANCRIAHDWYVLKGGSPAALTNKLFGIWRLWPTRSFQSRSEFLNISHRSTGLW